MSIWKVIKCKKCKTQDKPLFMISPITDKDDCFCKECLEKVREERAKGDKK